MVRVYSICDHAELFLNGKSLGTMQRDSQNFPAAGLRWQVEYAPGTNHLRVVATKGGVTVSDEIEQFYQTEPWGAPAELKLVEKSRRNGIVAVQATLLDAKGVHCLDGAHLVRFSLSEAGSLIDNLGTTRGSRAVQLANGRAEISLLYGGPCRIKAASDGLPATTLALS
jgi:beta-galactosidase